MPKRIFQLSCFLLLSLTSTAQSYTYDIIWRGDAIGEFTVVARDSNQYTIYEIVSDATIRLFGAKNIVTTMKTIYDENTLVASYHAYHRNDDLKECTEIRSRENKYQIIKDREMTSSFVHYPVSHSIGNMYHREPEYINKIFSERFGEYLNIDSDEKHHYAIEKPDGRETEYFYKNGVCQKVIVDNLFTSFSFVLKGVN